MVCRVRSFCGVQMEYAVRVDEGKEINLQVSSAPLWLECRDKDDSLLGMHAERVYINCPGLNGSILRGYLPAIQVKCERRVRSQRYVARWMPIPASIILPDRLVDIGLESKPMQAISSRIKENMRHES